LVLIMAIACMTVAGTTLGMLYRTAFEEEREALTAAAHGWARLIESIAKFDAVFSKDFPGGPEESALKQIAEAYGEQMEIGKTGEFSLGERRGDNIVFLLSRRYQESDTPQPVPMDSPLAEPMRRALSGLSGTMIGFDYRGERVLAAYEPVAGLHWGVVLKIDIAELRAPFIKAGAVAMGIAAALILLGAWLFIKITHPIISLLQENTRRLTTLVASLQQSEEKLQIARSDLEARVQERTRELVEANERMEAEGHERAQAEERLRALWKIAEMVDADDKNLYDNILEGTLRMTQSRYAFYGFMNADESVMSIHSWSSDVYEKCRMREQPIDYPIAKAGIWAEAVRKRKVLIVNDYSAGHPAKVGLPEGHVSLSRILVVPVFSHGRIVSVVAAANKPSPYSNEDVRQLEAFVSGVQVIIDQRKTEKQLRESEGKYAALVENSLIGIYISLDGEIVFANARFAEMHGYSQQQVPGMKSAMFIHPEERELFDAIREKWLSGEEAPLSYQIRGIKRNGDPLWTERSNVLIEYHGQRAILGNAVDITQRKEMEEALRASEKRCCFLSRQVIEAQENEKKRFSREMHDGLGQTLAAIKFRAQGYSRLNKEDAGVKNGEMDSLIQMIQSSIEEARKIQNDLRPAHIDELGLLTTMSGFCKRFQDTYRDIRLIPRLEVYEQDVPEYLKAPVYRIFQEAMNNAAKHSSARQIIVSFRNAKDRIELSVEDDGVGFKIDPVLRANPRRKGMGLSSMRERAELSAGSLEIISAPGKGTVIRAAWTTGEKSFEL